MVKICKLHINTVTYKLMNKFRVLIGFDLKLNSELRIKNLWSCKTTE